MKCYSQDSISKKAFWQKAGTFLYLICVHCTMCYYTVYEFIYAFVRWSPGKGRKKKASNERFSGPYFPRKAIWGGTPASL